MDRVSVFARRRRIKNLEEWTLYAILTEAFFLALSPTVASTAVVFGVMTWFLRSRIDTHYKMRSLPFDVPVAIFLLIGAASVFLSSARSLEQIKVDVVYSGTNVKLIGVSGGISYGGIASKSR